MKYRRLGKTDLKVSVIGVGTWQFGGEWGKTFTQNEVNGLFAKAKEEGINLIDTAECYGDHLSEKLVGEAIKKDRGDWIVATKFGHGFAGNFARHQLWSADDVLKQLEASLNALQTDYIDLYQFHSGADEAFDNDELWAMLNEQVQTGKIRHLGISIGKNSNLHQTAKASQIGASTIQVVYNRLDRVPEDAVFPSCEAQDLGVLARVPLASGYLSGKYKPGDTFTKEDDVRSRHEREGVQRKLEEVARIKADLPEGTDMAAWALAWCLQHDAVTCVIPGCKTIEQVEANARAAELDLVRNDHPQAIVSSF